MSQHLVDGGQRVSADREEAYVDVPHDARGEGAGTARRERFGGNGAGQGAGHAAEHGTGHVGGEGTAREDATLLALEALTEALGELSKEQRVLEKRLRDLHRQRSAGRAWRDILAGEADEDEPGTMQVVSHMLAELAKASGTLRKELVDTLRREGASIPAIAKLFGVTHQRVSNLLRRPAE